MELDTRTKSKRKRMMHSKRDSGDARGEKYSREGSIEYGKSRGFPVLDGNNRINLPDVRKGM